MKDVKWRIQRDDLKNASHIEVSVYYSKDGNPRGYYLRVRPITIGNNMVSYDLFSGRRKFLLETSRFSQKQLNFAVELAKGYEEELITVVVEENKAA